MLKGDLRSYPAHHAKLMANYVALTLKLGGSDNERFITTSFKLGAFAKNPLTAPDKLGNPNLPFSIAFCYGDQDWLGTKGADEIVRCNKFYKEGLSQIFIIKDADHQTYYDNPD